MPLIDLVLDAPPVPLPRNVRSFLRDAERRIERFQQSVRVPGFVPSDFNSAYWVLHALAETGLAKGNAFCEWGSGFGVIACLASMVGFDVCGIEIEAELVAAARQLAADFDLTADFVQASFIPRGDEKLFEVDRGFSWLCTEDDCGVEELDLAPDDFDVIFAYPWPDEEHLTATLFDRHAAVGAILLTHHGEQDYRLRRKTRPKRRI